MSLIKQLWLATLVLMLAAFGCSFVISTLSARNYLEQELSFKNRDNANVLALAMTQMPKDAATVELLVAAQFDNAHYDLIRLTDPTGEKVILERSTSDAEGKRQLGIRDDLQTVPAWFKHMVTLHPDAGVAFINDGWQAFGTLTVRSDTGFAYESLWRGSTNLLGSFAIGALVVCALGSLVLRWMLKPLDIVVEQAEAIGERRFISSPAPSTPEFAAVVNAMNILSERVRAILDGESARLDQLRRQAQHDAVSGLSNREHFMAQVSATLDNDDAPAEGALAIVRVEHLIQINEALGRKTADEVLRKLSNALERVAGDDGQMILGRLNGTDFALLSPDEPDPEALGLRISEQLDVSVRSSLPVEHAVLPVGIACYRRGAPLPQLLAHADVALNRSKENDGQTPHIERVDTTIRPATDLSSWRGLISEALALGRFSLVQFPVMRSDGGLLHHELPMRMHHPDNTSVLTAGDVIPWATRCGLLPQIDELVVDKALSLAESAEIDVCINLSVESMCHPGTVIRLLDKLKAQPDSARRLWIDLPENAAFRHAEAFRRLCGALKPLGCRIGLEHVSQQVCRIGELHDVGLDYLKISASVVREIDHHPGNQTFLRGLVSIGHTMGMQVIAEGVSRPEEKSLLTELGFDAMTGPGVR
ncbi:bifunctional diguanylate cyclase/phosphodiesterase [Nitrogeniibacter aestuarii]|uniref:bifunctional diguanylate cyclase/phosphodiesterase n=1 Tax=Nitrogeniibacter aestuarii TaxID=2815343 RepID=UPI001E328288|nr:EAL domain-containing protein [Nitrogeniibacter aestuarii]